MEKEKVELIFSGDAYFNKALKDIEQARSEVWLESYIYDLDPIGISFLNALEKAVQRGVKVRLMVDGIGTFNWARLLHKECIQKNISFRVFHPIPFVSTLFFKFSWRQVRQIILLFRKINIRNHRKVILIDRKIAYLGSYNISQVHSEHYLNERSWKDAGARIEDPDTTTIELLYRSYQQAWVYSKASWAIDVSSIVRRKWRKANVSHRIRLNSRAITRFRLLRDLLRRMDLAKDRILVTNAYFIPRRRFVRALRRAARRGVKVRLCLPSKTDVWIVREAAWSLYHRLLKDNVEIFEYQPSVLHEKTMVIDDWATVGSHNLNHRSLIHDLEVETVLNEPELVEKVVENWTQNVKKSKPITREHLGARLFFRRWISRFLWWFRYWL